MWTWGWGPGGCPSVPTTCLLLELLISSFRGRGGCGRGDGALVAARQRPPPHPFSWNCAKNSIVRGAPTVHRLFEMYRGLPPVLELLSTKEITCGLYHGWPGC